MNLVSSLGVCPYTQHNLSSFKYFFLLISTFPEMSITLYTNPSPLSFFFLLLILVHSNDDNNVVGIYALIRNILNLLALPFLIKDRSQCSGLVPNLL